MKIRMFQIVMKEEIMRTVMSDNIGKINREWMESAG
jgi:hypothetical protein